MRSGGCRCLKPAGDAHYRPTGERPGAHLVEHADHVFDVPNVQVGGDRGQISRPQRIAQTRPQFPSRVDPQQRDGVQDERHHGGVLGGATGHDARGHRAAVVDGAEHIGQRRAADRLPLRRQALSAVQVARALPVETSRRRCCSSASRTAANIVHVHSVGTKPSTAVNDLSAQALAEVGVDITGNTHTH